MNYSVLTDKSDIIKNSASIMSSLITALITTSLVYYNFSQRPEISFIEFIVEPTINDYGYLKNCSTEKNSKKYPTLINAVKCNIPPTFLFVKNDVTNLGFHIANIHEIRYYMTYPNKSLLGTVPKRISLENQERETILCSLGILEGEGVLLKGGTYRLKFEVIGATIRYSKQVWIHISEDLKTIKWSESRFKILTGF